MSFICSICQKEHDELPDIGLDRPAHYWDVAEEERDRRITLTTDTCEIDGKQFFVRGVIEIPVCDYPRSFAFGVWVSHKEENYRSYLNHPESADIGPFFGWLCSRISYYSEDTELLETTVHYRGAKLRPSIQVHQCDHQLFIDQQNGITLSKAWEIVHFYSKHERAT